MGQFYKLCDKKKVSRYTNQYLLASFKVMFMKANFKKAKDITIEKIIGSYPTLSDSEEQIAPTKSIKNAFAAIFKPVENPEEILFGKKEIAE